MHFLCQIFFGICFTADFAGLMIQVRKLEKIIYSSHLKANNKEKTVSPQDKPVKKEVSLLLI